MKKVIPKQIRFQIFWQMGAIIFLATTIGIIVNQIRSDRLPLATDRSPELRLTTCPGESVLLYGGN
jgi:hypothetical protein